MHYTLLYTAFADGARVEVKPVAAPKGTQSSLAADSAVGSGGGKGK